jgi:predicted HTH domain antitoxin
MRVITVFFGPGARDGLTAYMSVFSHDFKRFDRCTKLATSSRYQLMGEITLSIPDELLVALKVTPEQCGTELRLAAAVKLYELGRLSSGAAAKLAGIPRVVFLSKLADYGVDTFRLNAHDLAQETPLV